MKSLREISEAMTPGTWEFIYWSALEIENQFGTQCARESDGLGISIFCDEAVRKTLVKWYAGIVGDGVSMHDEDRLRNAITAALARAQGRER